MIGRPMEQRRLGSLHLPVALGCYIDRDIAQTHVIHCPLVPIEADPMTLLGHVHFVGKVLLEIAPAGGQLVRYYVDYNNERYTSIWNTHDVRDGTGITNATIDQANLNRVVVLSTMNARLRGRRQRGSGFNLVGSFQ